MQKQNGGNEFEEEWRGEEDVGGFLRRKGKGEM